MILNHTSSRGRLIQASGVEPEIPGSTLGLDNFSHVVSFVVIYGYDFVFIPVTPIVGRVSYLASVVSGVYTRNAVKRE